MDSKQYGPEDPNVAMSYYQMGNIFLNKDNKAHEVRAFFSKVGNPEAGAAASMR